MEQNRDNQTWRNDVHPSRLTDVVTVDTEMEHSVREDRTDRFASERFKEPGGHLIEREGRREGEERGREEGRRERGRDRRMTMDDGRRGRRVDGERGEGGGVERGRGGRVGRRGGEHGERGRGEMVRRHTISEHVERRGHVENEMEGDHVRGGERGRGGVTEGRGRGRGRGGWREGGRRRASELEREKVEMEQEDRDSSEKRLLESLTDPRDVPKGTWYFEVNVHVHD